MLKKGLFGILFLVFFSPFLSMATHNRAGEITYRRLSGLTYEVTILTYTYTPSPADRPELEIVWGDGTTSILPRTTMTDFPNDIRRNTYVGTHTYPGSGTYIISLEDPNRVGGVINIPNSINVPFYIETMLVINPFLGHNNSPVLLNPPIDNACVFQPYIHNPGAWDPDGDSLSYKLITCKGANGLDIPGYQLPSATNSITINPVTGDFLWDSPNMSGEQNIAILIEEWRNGVKIGSLIRDMQIKAVACNNKPPVIEDVPDTCVEAGTLLQFQVKANDPDLDVVTLTATGGPFLLNNSPATFPQPVSGTGSVTSVFTWQTNCSHVKKIPYQVYFKAKDNGSPVNLVDIETVSIKVVGSAPKNLTATPIGSNVLLNWNKSICPNAIGYKIYRRAGYYGFFPGHCETGVPAYTGYKKIRELQGINDTDFVDSNNGLGLSPGGEYCYMVIAFYPDSADSYASLEACTTLKKEVPVITNVSINNTDPNNGSIYIAWSKPTDIDTIQIPGPYKYLIYRAQGITGTNFTLIDSLASLNDTIYTDTLLNTTDFGYTYKIDLINNSPGNRFYVGSTQPATSIFLTFTPNDNRLTINMNNNVPWVNQQYVVYRRNPVTLLFDSIGWSSVPSYDDTGLANGVSYCYLVKSIGTYFSTGYVDPIINYSQIACGIPEDKTPPCAPSLTVDTSCLRLENYLSWTNPNLICTDDVVRYNIYYAETLNGDFTIIDTTSSQLETTFTHSGLFSIAACYAVTAIDSFDNQSVFSNKVCVDIDSCSLYKLPNVFTPNNDDYNDFFTPFPYSFVERIDIEIFNRWGDVMYTTEDPDIMWDGKYRENDCSEGVYYYVCNVYERRLEGLTMRTISGFVHLLR